MFLNGFVLLFTSLIALFIVRDSLLELLVKKTSKLVKQGHCWNFDIVSNVDIILSFLGMLFVGILMNVIHKLFEQMAHQM